MMRALAVAALLSAAPAWAAEGHGTATNSRLPSLLATAGPDIVEKDGTLSWRVLADIRTIQHDNNDGRFGRGIAYYLEPVAPAPLRAMASSKVRVKGYMLPRSPLEGRSRFLVAALPAADEDGCNAGKTENVVDVLVDGPVDAQVDRLVTVEGTLLLGEGTTPKGYLYRLADARIVRQQ